jgi:hypothetical protein
MEKTALTNLTVRYRVSLLQKGPAPTCRGPAPYANRGDSEGFYSFFNTISAVIFQIFGILPGLPGKDVAMILNADTLI